MDYNTAMVNYDSNVSLRVPRKEKLITDVLLEPMHNRKKTPKHYGAQLYFLLRNKAGIHERKWKAHISENCFGESFNQASIKDVLGRALGKRVNYVKHHQKYEKKWKRKLKKFNK